MKKWVQEFQDLILISGALLGILLYLIGTFATQAALAEKENNIKSYVDQKHNAVETELSNIKTVLDRIDQRVYEIQKNK